jgi:cytochrome b
LRRKTRHRVGDPRPLVVLITLHLIGVVLTSVHRRENLIAAMSHRRKRAPRDRDIA